jgi:hypothetical protein
MITMPRSRLLLGVHASFVVLLFGCSQSASVAQQSPSSDPAIKAYQVLMVTDDNAMGASTSNHCNTVQDTACPAAAAHVVAALQTWLDHLIRFQTPARFATIDAQMRRHIAAAIAYLNASAAATLAQNQPALDRSIAAAINEKGWVDHLTASISQSNHATTAIYTSLVKSEKSDLDKCGGCQRLISQAPLNCGGAAATDCDSFVTDAAGQVQTFQGAVVLDSAPSNLAAKDTQLQSDLAQCDTALIGMMGALLKGDESGFSAGRSSFVRALAAVDTDAAAV